MINKLDGEECFEKEIRVYRIRWVILIVFILGFASISLQWVQYTIIADTVVEYYGVTYEAVNWTAMVYLLTNAVFCLGGSYIINALGLRNALLLGMFLASAGAWVKVASVSPDKFWVAILGQAVVGASQVFALASPSKLAATWFGPNEVSSACSMGFLGGQMGIAIGFLIPPMLIKNNTDKNTVEHGMYTMLIAVAILNTVVLILTFIFFQDHPSSPPSQAELNKGQRQEAVNFMQSLKSLFSNSSYLLETVIAVFALTCISMLIFTFTIDKGIEVVYVVSGIVGFFMTGLFPAGYELVVELTYPIEESTSAGLALLLVQIFGILLTYLYSTLLNNIGYKITNSIMSGLLVVGTILLFFVRFELRRSAAEEQVKEPQNAAERF